MKKYLSRFGVWALAFGCSVGWGAFVMPGSTFLPIAGPLGTAVGMGFGAVIMVLIGANYQYMMNLYPEAGGAFLYTSRVFGYDHGFLNAWFLILTYIAIIWANMTALALIARNVLGNVLQFGFHYTLAGYDIYFGEILFELLALFAVGAVCIFGKRLAGWLQIVLAVLLIGGIIVAFAVVAAKSGGVSVMTPAFQPEGSRFGQIFNIVALTPWAFIGFESVSHSAEEFRFPVKKTMLPMTIAVGTGFVAYTLLTFVASSVQPEGFSGWTDYIAALSGQSGLAGIPTFFAVHSTMGNAGLLLLGVVLLAGIFTGMIGNTIAASRLIYFMAEKGVFPARFGSVDKKGTPKRAILFIVALSLVIPFFGRTAIGWIVDVTTIGACIAYGYTSAAVLRDAYLKGNKKMLVTGVIGLVMSVVFSLFLLIPNFWSVTALAAESYLILAVWSILGFLYFRVVFKHDAARRFGKSTVVWIALLFLLFFTSLMWMRQATHTRTEQLVGEVTDYYTAEMEEAGIERDSAEAAEEQFYIESRMDSLRKSLLNNSVVQMVLIILGIVIIFNNYYEMQKREKQIEKERRKAEENSQAKSIFLANMSHDIRTPMNAIIGYTQLARQPGVTMEEMKDLLTKIEGSSQHLLALINDVLEMSRIESGKMELAEMPTDLRHMMKELHEMFVNQMQTKNINYTVEIAPETHTHVLCDKNRLNRVLLNLVSNAYKFTPENGEVAVRLSQEEEIYVLTIKDSGIGMSEEFAEKVFEVFERERDSTVSGIQGTGLGMAITKSIVDLMGGEISVQTKKDQGTVFTLRLPFKVCADAEVAEDEEKEEAKGDFTKMRVLLVEDMMVNREIATMLLKNLGFTVETAENGQEAVDKVTAAGPGYFNAVLMDIQMPVMNGYEATEAIRALPEPALSTIPIIAMTANAFQEDVEKAKAAGMNAHIAKPVDLKILQATLSEILS